MNANFQSFAKQGQACRDMGSPLTATILEALSIVLDETTLTGRRISAWPVEPLADAVPLRLAGGLHAIARRCADPALTELYRNFSGDLEATLRTALIAYDSELITWLESPPQTNEVGRSGALYAGLLVIADQFDHPIELLELGASAGLNLNLDKFAYVLGGESFGDEASAVKIAPQWQGNAPPKAKPLIVARTGVDLNPLDVGDKLVAERLIAYVWPDQLERLTRIAAAISVARENPPRVDAGDAADWLEQALSQPQREQTVRVIMHSVFWQYLPKVTQQKIIDLIKKASQAASEERSLAYLTFEAGTSLYSMTLKLKIWPGENEQILANCHPHATTIDWLV